MASAENAREFRRVLAELRRYGLLLQTDAQLPSVAAVVTGAPVRGSWWAHSRAHDIYQATHQLREHPDVIYAKLISAKVTYVHRKLWPALLGVATSRERWQTQGLSTSGRALLERVESAEWLRTDELAKRWRSGSKSLTDATRQLERRLLVYSEEVHTESGAHAKRVETWAHWCVRAGSRRPALAAADARKRLEQAVAKMVPAPSKPPRLPWGSSTGD